jgi:predicted nuclease of predicted toxin-antitoxin system
MKLLFDQNISFRLIHKISDFFPEARQVRELGLENATDLEIFEFAVKNDYTIVTFDSDFCDLNILKGFPLKIIWLRTGNTTTKNLESIFRNRLNLIKAFMNEENACLEISD